MAPLALVLGEWAGWRQLPPPNLQVTRETLSSRAGATVLVPIFLLLFGDQDWAFGVSIVWHVCFRPGWRYPARQWPGPGSWRGGEQPGRWSPGGWRSCGGGANCSNIKILSESISAFRECEGLFARSLGLCIFSRECWNQKFWLLNSSVFYFTFTFCSFLYCVLCLISSVLDKDPSGLKVLARC